MSAGEDAIPRTRSLLQQGMSDHLHLGAQLYVSLRGRVVADLAVGEAAPGAPLRPDMLLPWLSATKPLAAIALAGFVEQGRLHFDDPVARLIPEFAQGGKQAITLRHLLTHTAGFRAADQIPQDQDDSIARICATPIEPGWVPGEKAGYQTFSSWRILGEVIRRLSGLEFGRYVRERIFEPLGMNDSWVGLPREHLEPCRPRLAFLWNTVAPPPVPFESTDQDLVACRPASGGRGPARELGRFYEWLLRGRAGEVAAAERLVDPETIRLLTRRHRVGLFDHTFRHTIDWGLGFIINSNRYGADTVPYGYGRHASDDAFGHGGAQSASAFADPAHGLVVVWVCNGRPGEARHNRRARSVNTAIYEDLGLP